MKNSNFNLTREETSDTVLGWAAAINMCHLALQSVIDGIEESPVEYSILCLVQERLGSIQSQINQFDTDNL